jgi:hypothetical protein
LYIKEIICFFPRYLKGEKMKKLISIICIFSILLLIFLLVEYVQLRQPSFIAINNAISWAESLVGQSSFPVVGGGSSPSQNMCSEFVAVAYGANTASDAYTWWTWTTLDQHPGDWNAPRGSLVFFARSASSGVGHVALCIGNGKLVEAGYSSIKTNTISDEAENPESYLGWAWPPSSWPGRGDGLAAAAFIMNVENFVKENIKSALHKYVY